MKSIMTSVSPYLCEKIASGQCKILVRKSAPKEVPFKAYIYCCKGKPYLYRVDDDDNFELARTLRAKVDGYVKDYNEQNGKVIGEFICDKVEVLFNTNGNPENYMTDILPTVLQKTALSFKEFQDYVGSRSDKNNIYGWHISDLKIYDKPKKLNEFKRPCSYAGLCFSCYRAKFTSKGDKVCEALITRPPQSYMFVEEI